MIPFLWPCSDASGLPGVRLKERYHQDQAMAKVFAACLGRVLTWIDKNISPVCHINIHAFCHSMGNMIFSQALKSAQKIVARPLRFFTSVAMVAADVDNNIFETDLGDNILVSTENLVIFYGRKDKALKKSGQLHSLPRLGLTGPFPTHMTPKVHLHDCANIQTLSNLGHDYKTHPEVIKEVGKYLQRD